MSEYIIDLAAHNVNAAIALCDGVHEEIVRCKDCTHYTEDEMEYWHYCGSWCSQVKPDGFCAWGERRSDGPRN